MARAEIEEKAQMVKERDKRITQLEGEVRVMRKEIDKKRQEAIDAAEKL
jgi:hypothetical protein